MSLVYQFLVKHAYSLYLNVIACCLLVMGICIKPASAMVVYPACLDAPTGCAEIYDSWNRDGVANNPLTNPVFTITKPWVIYNIINYHYGSEKDPVSVNGHISLYNNVSGELIGSWAASEVILPTPNPRSYSWIVSPNVILNPGTYKIVDSDPASWSYSTTDFYHKPGDGPNWKPNQGFSAVHAYPYGKSFAAFIPRVEMNFSPNSKEDSFHLSGYFKLAPDSNGINPLQETVVIKVGTFSTSVTVGSFQQDGQGFKYVDQVKHYGIFIQPLPRYGSEALIQSQRNQRPGEYKVTLRSKAINLDGIIVPPTVQLIIGDDLGQSKLDIGKAMFGKRDDRQRRIFHDYIE